MAERRRIVLDNSVVVPAFFREVTMHGGHSFDLTRRAKPLVDAVRAQRSVITYAPEQLWVEFFKAADEKTRPRSGASSVDAAIADRIVLEFRALPITYVPGSLLAELAWWLMRDERMSPPDSWYVACARRYEAELWISHEHEDQLVEKARAVGVRTFVLTADRFE